MINRRINVFRRRLMRRRIFNTQVILLFWAVLMGVIGALAI